MGFGQKIKDAILGKQKKIIHVPISPESIQDNHQVKALSYENAELKGENAKLKDFIGKIKERDTDKNEEENVKAVLNSQKNEIILKTIKQKLKIFDENENMETYKIVDEIKKILKVEGHKW